VTKAEFIACHQTSFLEKYEMLETAVKGATFLLNTPHSAESVWDTLPKEVQEAIVEKQLKFYVIDAYEVAKNTAWASAYNTIMQTCFFANQWRPAP